MKFHWPKVNHEIEAKEVRVISHDGEQLGIMPIKQAHLLAQSQGLDLLEVSSSAQPPVCRILDFEKYKKLTQEKAGTCNCPHGKHYSFED